MKFKELTSAEKKYIAKIHGDKDMSWDNRIDHLKDKFKISERSARKWTEKLGLTKPSEQPSPQYELAKLKKHDSKKKVFLIGWAQNDTPAHENLITNMEAYSKERDGDIHIIAGRYRNPTSIWNINNQKAESWSSRISKYLDAARHNVHQYMSIMSDVKIQPTAVNPLSGLQGMSRENSCIFGHPKVHMEMIPTLDTDKPKMMLTTGAVTIPNYTDSKSGKKGEFHHMLGFVVVEIHNKDIFYVRQVTADDDGNFNDLYYNVKDGVVSKNETINSLIMGDLHYANHDKDVLSLTTNVLMKKLKPKNLILHDVFDGYAINHHEIKNPFTQYRKEIEGTNSLKKEVDDLMQFLKGLRDYKIPNVVVVRSNHDDFIDRWLINTDWRSTVTPKNSLEYMEYSAAILRNEAPRGIIPWVIDKEVPEVMALGITDGFKSKGWELGQHGDGGSNGSRGSLEQFRKLNTKIIIGHYHTPGRKDGALAVGTSTTLKMGYNEKGTSSWLQSHVIVHEDGKAQHINFIRNKKDNTLGFTTIETKNNKKQ